MAKVAKSITTPGILPEGRTLEDMTADELKVAIKNIQVELASHNVSRNQQYKKSQAIPDEIWERRVVLIPQMLLIEQQLKKMNAIGKTVDRTKNIQFNATVNDIIIEIIGKEEFRKIRNEAVRRVSGQAPEKVTLLYGYNPADKEEIKRLTKIGSELKNYLLNGRKSINRYINENEPEINKADYFLKIKALTNSLPTEKEIYNIKIGV